MVRFAGTSESEHSVFWLGTARVLLLPSGVDEQWLADVHRALGLEVRHSSRPSRSAVD